MNVYRIENRDALAALPALGCYRHKEALAVIIVRAGQLPVEELLRSGALQNAAGMDEQAADAFIREYVELIGRWNKGQVSWPAWGSGLSSKSPYNTALAKGLEMCVLLDHAVSQNPDGCWLVVVPSFFWAQFVREEVLPSGALAADLTGPLFRALALAGPLLAFVRVLRDVWRAMSRVFLCRCVFGRFQLRMDMKGCWIIKSFAHERSFEESGFRDHFWGQFREYLVKDGRRALTVVTILGNFRHVIGRLKHQACRDVFPTECFLTAGDVLLSAWHIVACRYSFDQPLRFREWDLSRVIRTEVAGLSGGIQLHQLIHYFAFRRLAAVLGPARVFLTHENNPWERVSIAAMRQVSPASILVGYQHSVVYPALVNVFQSVQERGLPIYPDVVVTSGKAPMAMMARYSDPHCVPLVEGCSLRYEHVLSAQPPSVKTGQSLLVLLDGVRETEEMLGYVLDALAEGASEPLDVIVRFHPAWPPEALSGSLRKKLFGSGRIRISDGTLSEDIACARAVVYWQSGAALEALACGVPVMAYAPGRLLNFDPLWGMSSLRWMVGPGRESPVAVFLRLHDVSDEARRHAQACAREYFLSVTPQRLGVFSSCAGKP
ncbi:MAG: hypothetical protein HQL19_04825 [Candidatus Omnitrophica bacterium]|nr:hypothetical protein [Candidatus Omnitrophota bacterium]